MCDLVIYNKDNTHTNPAKDLRGCHKRGDLIETAPDGARGEHAHAGGVFVIIHAPNITEKELDKYLNPEEEVRFVTARGTKVKDVVRRKRYGFDLDRLLSQPFIEEVSKFTYRTKVGLGDLVKLEESIKEKKTAQLVRAASEILR